MMNNGTTLLSTLNGRRVFTRNLLFIWLLTWTMADPLYLLQDFLTTNAPAETSLSSAYPAGLHFARHYLDVLSGSCTEGTSNHGNSTPSDDLGIGETGDLTRPDLARPFAVWIGTFSLLFDSPLTSPRAPPYLFA